MLLAQLIKVFLFTTSSFYILRCLLHRILQLESHSLLKIPLEPSSLLEVEPPMVQRQTIRQTMERLPSGTRRLAAQLRTSISHEALWEVLTDYDHLSDFIPNLTSSSVIARNGNRVQLKQIGSQRLMGFKFSAQVEIELIEDKKNGQLKFNLVKGDFRRFEGLWKLTKLPNNNGTCLLYDLTVQGCVGMPVSLIEQRLRDDLTANLLAVENAALKIN